MGAIYHLAVERHNNAPVVLDQFSASEKVETGFSVTCRRTLIVNGQDAGLDAPPPCWTEKEVQPETQSPKVCTVHFIAQKPKRIVHNNEEIACAHARGDC
jgi:hypothetical protein